MESLSLDAKSLEVFIGWVSHEYPSLAPELVERAHKFIEAGETVTFQKVVESPSTSLSPPPKPLVINEDTKMTSENYAIVLKYLENIYTGEQYEIMKEVVQKRIVEGGEYFEVSFLNAISVDILRERIQERKKERIRQVKPEGVEDRRALFAKAALARLEVKEEP